MYLYLHYTRKRIHLSRYVIIKDKKGENEMKPYEREKDEIDEIFDLLKKMNNGNAIDVIECADDLSTYDFWIEGIEYFQIHDLVKGETRKKWEMVEYLSYENTIIHFRDSGVELKNDFKIKSFWDHIGMDYIYTYQYPSPSFEKAKEIVSMPQYRVRRMVDPNYYIEFDEYLNEKESEQLRKDVEHLVCQHIKDVFQETTPYFEKMNDQIKEIIQKAHAF